MKWFIALNILSSTYLPIKKNPGAVLPEKIQAPAQVPYRHSFLVISNAEFRMSTCQRGTLKELVKSWGGLLQRVAQAPVQP